MILVDTGPLVALFNPRDFEHELCAAALQSISDPILTTIPVLNEAFHILQPEGPESQALRDFIQEDALKIWFLDKQTLTRTFELMEQYADHPMDMADASLIAAAEILETHRIFTMDRKDFNTYRIRKGHRFHPVEILPD